MTVAELIAELSKLPQDATALVKHELGWRPAEVCRGAGTEYGLPQPFVCIVPAQQEDIMAHELDTEASAAVHPFDGPIGSTVEWDGRRWRREAPISGFVRLDGGLRPLSIGARFAGKKPGTWRHVVNLTDDGRYVFWRNDGGHCQLSPAGTWHYYFRKWVDRSKLVLVPIK